mmetsp:Transcript_901/g.1117  ORF Transcript_901/g.1117 Transcript_901/m.1117 type:complete len:118 (+) Transcript_901:124-477(+)
MASIHDKSNNSLIEEDLSPSSPPMPQAPQREDTQESIDYYYNDDDGYGDYDDFTALGHKSGGGGGGNARQQKKNHQRDNSGNHGPYSAKHTRLITARQERQHKGSTNTTKAPAVVKK